MLSSYIVRVSNVSIRAGISSLYDPRPKTYYNLLEVESGATTQQIFRIYKQKCLDLHPSNHAEELDKLSQAFVILSNPKSRIAYDSLLDVKKYLQPQENIQNKIIKKSLISQRKAKKLKEVKKLMNLDDFGRYKGGLPTPDNKIRKGNFNTVFTMHQTDEINIKLDQYPEYPSVNDQKLQSFTSFTDTQQERNARYQKKTFKTYQVNYKYFTMVDFRKRFWRKIQLVVLIFYIVPAFISAYDVYRKKIYTNQIRKTADPELLKRVLRYA